MYRLEIKQNYHLVDSAGIKPSFFSIMSKIGAFINVSVYSRSRILKDKEFFSFTVISYTKQNHFNLINYFKKFPLLSSKYLDYKDWLRILELQTANNLTTSYLETAIKTRTDFNSTRTTYTWNHLKNSYLEKRKEY
jgi:hypothetical protein